jgi:hypothetical protein
VIGLQEGTWSQLEVVEFVWEVVEQTQHWAGGQADPLEVLPSEVLVGAAEWLVPVQAQERRVTEHTVMEHTG